MSLAFSPEKIEHWPLARLKPCARNAKHHGEDQVAKIAASMAEFGWTVPCLVAEDGELVAGHGRVLAAERLGLDTAPVIVVGHLTEEQRRAYRIADNKLTELGEWDEATLSAELQELIALEYDVSLTGFSDEEMDALLREAEGGGEGAGGEEDDEPEVYSRKIEAPVYEPKGDRPEPGELYDESKARDLIAEIDAADLPEDVAAFLRAAAYRHTSFDFAQIAEFYAHAPAETQRLMERSALVIIDFDAAIENGFVRLTQQLGNIVGREYPDDG